MRRDRTRVWAVALALTISLLGRGEVAANSTFLEEVGLDVLIEDSQLILIAHADDPFEEKVVHEITPNGVAPDPERYPPYHELRRRFVVDEVIVDRMKSSGVGVGSRITMTGADAESMIDLHRGYHVENLRKSPIYRSYRAEPWVDPAKGKVLLFLRRDERGDRLLRLTIQGAIEGPEVKTRVQEALGLADGSASAAVDSPPAPGPDFTEVIITSKTPEGGYAHKTVTGDGALKGGHLSGSPDSPRVYESTGRMSKEDLATLRHLIPEALNCEPPPPVPKGTARIEVNIVVTKGKSGSFAVTQKRHFQCPKLKAIWELMSRQDVGAW